MYHLKTVVEAQFCCPFPVKLYHVYLCMIILSNVTCLLRSYGVNILSFDLLYSAYFQFLLVFNATFINMLFHHWLEHWLKKTKLFCCCNFFKKVPECHSARKKGLHTYIHAYIHTHIHTHTYTYIHTYILHTRFAIYCLSDRSLFVILSLMVLFVIFLRQHIPDVWIVWFCAIFNILVWLS
jgi:hypothetical protein